MIQDRSILIADQQ